MTSEHNPEHMQTRPTMTRGMVWLMATMVGVTVANNYYAQPLLADIAQQFHLSVTQAGTVAMLAQIGTAFGMFLFVPLGDKFERRGLVSNLLLAAALSLVLVAIAGNPVWLALAFFAVGATAATVHVLVPFAAHLAAPAERGRVVGTVLGGLLFGVLLARTFSGSVGAVLGWRAVFWIGAVAMLVLSAVARLRLPKDAPEAPLPWLELMRSAFGFVRQHAVLREAACIGALSFSAFSAFWTTLAFYLQSPAYGYGSAVAGLFGLVGAAGASGAPFVGHLADKYGARTTIRIALWVTLLSLAVMGAFGGTLAGLIIGVIGMDLGVQSSHVSNQTRIYQIDPAARSRLNMVYMVCYFIGGACGSYFGSVAWHLAGWWGVCGYGAATQVVALVVLAISARERTAPVRSRCVVTADAEV